MGKKAFRHFSEFWLQYPKCPRGLSAFCHIASPLPSSYNKYMRAMQRAAEFAHSWVVWLKFVNTLICLGPDLSRSLCDAAVETTTDCLIFHLGTSHHFPHTYCLCSHRPSPPVCVLPWLKPGENTNRPRLYILRVGSAFPAG